MKMRLWNAFEMLVQRIVFEVDSRNPEKFDSPSGVVGRLCVHVTPVTHASLEKNFQTKYFFNFFTIKLMANFKVKIKIGFTFCNVNDNYKPKTIHFQLGRDIFYCNVIRNKNNLLRIRSLGIRKITHFKL
jgi:hypothetical protein